MRAFLLALLLTLAVPVAAQDAPDRPNVVLIMTDDQGYGDLGLHGNPHLQTPRLDALAAEGVRLERFYVSPVCAPTRAALLTGQYPQRVGVRSVTNGYETMDPEAVTLAEILSAAGYRTGLFGKWHLGEYWPSHPNAQGFDTFVGFRTGHTDDYFDAVLERNGEPYPTEGYITDVLTDEAIRFMEAAGDEPFFLYLPYNAPHTPLLAPDRYVDPFLEAGFDERTAYVYAMVENLDDNIGRLLERLDGLGLADETLVLFLTDNGPISGWRVPQEEMRFNAGLRDQKFTVYEGGVRVPFFARWPGVIPPGPTVETPAAHIDVLPTVLDLAGVPLPDSLRVDGRSLRPLLVEPERAPGPELAERPLFLHFDLGTLADPEPAPGGAVWDGRFKLVHGRELYDLDADPGERHDLSGRHPQRVDALRRAYDAWWAEIAGTRGFDIRPIPIGHAAEDPILQPHHGRAEGGLKYYGIRGTGRIGTHPSGVDGDWVADWSTPGDAIRWTVSAVRGGRYSVVLHVRAAELGATAIVEVGDQRVTGALPAADRPVGEWVEVPLGAVTLAPGPHPLVVQMEGAAAAGVALGGVGLVFRGPTAE